MTRADRVAEAARVAADKHADFFIMLKSADFTPEEKRALQLPLFNELGIAMKALREELEDYRSAPPVDVEACARAIKEIPKDKCYPLSYQERLLVARAVLREAGVGE